MYARNAEACSQTLRARFTSHSSSGCWRERDADATRGQNVSARWYGDDRATARLTLTRAWPRNNARNVCSTGHLMTTSGTATACRAAARPRTICPHARSAPSASRPRFSPSLLCLSISPSYNPEHFGGGDDPVQRVAAATRTTTTAVAAAVATAVTAAASAAAAASGAMIATCPH